MFSDNNHISSRQLGRMAINEKIGIICLFAGILAGEFGGIIYCGILPVMLCISLAALWIIFKIPENIVNKIKNSIIFRSYVVVRMLAMVMAGLYLIYLSTDKIWFEDTPAIMLICFALTVCVQVASLKVQELGRFHEIIWWIIIISLIVLLVTSSAKIDIGIIGGQLKDKMNFNVSRKNAGGYYYALILFGMTAYYEKIIILKDNFYNTAGARKKLYISNIVSYLAGIWVFLVCIGVFGEKGSLFKLMDISGIPGGFINRQIAIMALFLIVSLVAYVSDMLFYIKMVLNEKLVGKLSGKKTKEILIGVFLGVCIITGIARKGIIGGTDIENRDYVMSIQIDEGEKTTTLELAGISGENRELVYNTCDKNVLVKKHLESGGKPLDFSHIKGVLLVNSDQPEKIIGEMQEDTDISGNVPVYITDQREEAVGLGNKIENKTENIQGKEKHSLYRMNRK